MVINRKPPFPKDDTRTTSQPRCPDCGATCVVKIGAQWICNHCAKQWPPIRRVQQRPTRADILNGTAHYGRARIIFWRFR
jgi:hypothetical protein